MYKVFSTLNCVSDRIFVPIFSVGVSLIFFCPIYVTYLTGDQKKKMKFEMPSSVVLSLISVIYVDYLKAFFIESV